MRERITTREWLALIGSLIAATAAFCGFVYATFETQTHSKETKDDIVKVLDEIRTDVKTLLKRQD